MDMKEVLTDPARFFGEPEEVLQHATLSREDKLNILRRWEFDARELEVADDENMAGNEEDLLGRIHDALRQLEAEPGASAPTKQGGPA